MAQAQDNCASHEIHDPAAAPARGAAHILLVDHDELVRESVARTLMRGGHRVAAVGDAKAALGQVALQPFALLIAEAKLPNMSGIELLGEARRLRPDMPVILMAAYASMRTALEAMRRGAQDYIQKPFEKEELLLRVSRALEHAALRRENHALRHAAGMSQPPVAFVGGGGSGRRVRETIAHFATTAGPILIRGESGTGKKLAARLIHAASDRRDRPLLALNCAAREEQLIEIHLFGRHGGGGLEPAQRGLFELAGAGTLLLEEVSAIAPDLQLRLLGAISRDSTDCAATCSRQPTDVRVISTTSRSLEQADARGALRGDLQACLRARTLELLPLRDRREDVPELVRHFLHQIAKRRREPFRHIEPEALRALQRYSWPGNVRELEHIIERAAIIESHPGVVRAATIAPWLEESPSLNGHRQTSTGDPLDRLPLAEVEKRVILDTLAKFEGHRAKTAGALGIGIRTLGIKLKKWRQEGEILEVSCM